MFYDTIVKFNYIIVIILVLLMTKSNSLLIIGLNPAYQRSIQLNNLNNGEVNRGQSVSLGIGGKGQNCAVATKCLTNIDIKLVQFVGSGHEGDALIDLIEKSQISTITQRINGPCRCAITLVDQSKDMEATEIVEPSSKVNSNDIDAILHEVKQLSNNESKSNKNSAIAFMGSAPPGCEPDLYGKFVKASMPKKIVVDTLFGLDSIFENAEDIDASVLLKVNGRELCKLANIPIEVSGSENFVATPLNAIKAAVRKLFGQYASLHYILVTDSKFPTNVFDKEMFISHSPSSYWRVANADLSTIGPVVSPIGAGDAFAAGVLVSWGSTPSSTSEVMKIINKNKVDNDNEILDAAMMGAAAGAASCLFPGCSKFDLKSFEQVYYGITVIKEEQ